MNVERVVWRKGKGAGGGGEWKNEREGEDIGEEEEAKEKQIMNRNEQQPTIRKFAIILWKGKLRLLNNIQHNITLRIELLARFCGMHARICLITNTHWML